MALLIVVSILTVIGIMGVAFAFSMFLETQATREFVATTQARYLAEASVNHARVLLDEDRLGSRIDDREEGWGRDLGGQDVDTDGDGVADARWWLVKGPTNSTAGRYAIHVTDEGGKANLNMGQAEPIAWGLGAINLTTLLGAAGIENAQTAAQTIERYRYGEDEKPGVADVDDDGDGAIDEVDEYQPLALRGDDRRLEGMEDLVGMAGLTIEQVRRLSQFATVYSWDLNVSATGRTRVNANTATTNELLGVLLEVGVEDPWQVAVNMSDYVDADLEMSRVTKASQTISMTNQGPLGGWVWRDDPQGHYHSEGPGGEKLSWATTVPTGRFRILAHGLGGLKVGDVSIAGELHASINDGESLGVFDLGEVLTVQIDNREPAGIPCAFRGLELVVEGSESGVGVRGIEAVRFNEVMVEPTITMDVTAASFDPLGSDWGCPVGASVCSISGVGQARWSWTNPLLQPGRYYVRMFGSAPGQTVGDVRVEGTTQRLVHGERHPSTISVGSDGKISLAIGKTAADGTYYFKGVALSLQPDAEYVEFINLSDSDINMTGWTIEGELTGGHQGRLPAGSTIKAHGLLVAAVDVEDRHETLGGNGIDARSTWQIPDDVKIVQLEFPGGPPSPDDDWLKVTIPSGTPARLIVRGANGVIVDEVQYAHPLITTTPFQSLEKGDPSVIMDQNGDGIDDGWYPSLKLYTPGQDNNNEGLREIEGLDTLTHDPRKEVTILNRPLGGVGELAGMPSGQAWKPFASADLAKLVDRLTVEGYRLEAEGHWIEAGGGLAWEEKADGYYLHTDPAKTDLAGRWRWAGLPDGAYRLSLYGCEGCLGEQLSVRWERRDGSFTEWSPPLATDARGRITLGQISIGMGDDGTASGSLVLEARCASESGICHFDHARLDPQLIRVGPVNVNTAPLEVLRALPGMTEALASRIITGRPYGDQEQKGRGIGDLLIGDVLGSDEETKLAVFRQLAHLLTTRSDVFQILGLGQSMDGGRVAATQRVQAIIQR